ncbi:hypothetical protein ACX80L_12980 [Arthrobacter sp. MDT1-48-3]
MTEPLPTEWDDALGVSKMTWRSEAPPQNVPNRTTYMVVEPDAAGMLARRMLYKPADSRTLLVSMHGALNRGKYAIPRFEWQQTLGRTDCAQLYLSDSTLELNNSIEIGWYIGTADHDLLSDYAELVRSVVVGGNYSRVVCIGSSAGGFAALALSRAITNSVAVVFSPQTSIGGYHPRQRRALLEASFSDYSSYDEVESKFGQRMNMLRLYGGTADTNFVHYVQNTRDPFHYDAHYVPFALLMGVNPEQGGPSDRHPISFHPERQAEGHAPPSRGRLLRHVDEAHRAHFGTSITIRPPGEAQRPDIIGSGS